MKILAKNGKVIKLNGGAILAPSAAGSGGTATVSYNTVEPDRYSVNIDDQTASLNLTGLVTGTYYICNMTFLGTALDAVQNEDITGDSMSYSITVFNTGDEQYDYIGYSSQDFFAKSSVQYNSNLILNLDMFFEATKNEHAYGMAYNITEELTSIIVSWD